MVVEEQIKQKFNSVDARYWGSYTKVWTTEAELKHVNLLSIAQCQHYLDIFGLRKKWGRVDKRLVWARLVERVKGAT